MYRDKNLRLRRGPKATPREKSALAEIEERRVAKEQSKMKHESLLDPAVEETGTHVILGEDEEDKGVSLSICVQYI